MLTIRTTTCFIYNVVVGKTYSHFVHFCSKVDSLATQLFLWTPLKNKNKNKNP